METSDFFDPIILFMNVLLRNEHKKWYYRVLDELNDQKIEIKQSNKCGYERFRYLDNYFENRNISLREQKIIVIGEGYHASS